MAAVAAVVVNPAAAADPPEVAAAEWEAAARAVVVVNPAVAAVRVEEDKVVAADAHRVVEAEPARVVVDRAVAVVDVPLGVDKVVVGKVAEEAAVARVVAADPLAVVAEWEVEEAVPVNPAVVGAAETVNSLASSGASRACGAPFFY